MQPALLQRGGSRLQGRGCCTLLPAASRSCGIARPWAAHRQHSSSKPAQRITALPSEDDTASGGNVNNSADIIAAADISTAAVPSNSSNSSSSSNGQIARLAYASLSVVALGCAVFAGKAFAAEQRSTTLPPPSQIHSVTSSTNSSISSSRRRKIVPTQPLQLPFASVSQQQAPEAAAAAVAAQPAVPLRQPRCAAAGANKHSSLNAELHYRVRQVSNAVGLYTATSPNYVTLVAAGMVCQLQQQQQQDLQ
jgi:hypothetical protein